MDSLELAHRIIDTLVDKKGENVVLLDVEQVTPIARYFVLANGDNERQLKALIDYVREAVKTAIQKTPLRTEGRGESGWVLMDYGDVIVHLFSPRLRKYYDLESMWADANVVVRIQ